MDVSIVFISPFFLKHVPFIFYNIYFFFLSDVILRPGFIYGTRRVGSMKLPLGVIGSPLEMVRIINQELSILV